MATASLDKELAAAREPIPVRREETSVSQGPTATLDNASAKARPTTKFTTSGGGQEGWDVPNLSLAGIQTWLKLRTKRELRPRLTADLGLDVNPRGPVVRPLAALTYQLRSKDADWAKLRATHQRAVIVKDFDVALDRARIPVSFTLKTAAGVTYAGRPDFDVNVSDVKPGWLVGVAAVTLLLLRQPLTGVKQIGSAKTFDSPFAGEAKGEFKARAQRKGDGLELGISQLNAIIRI